MLELRNLYCGLPQDSSFLRQNVVLLGKGFPSNEGVRAVRPWKNFILSLLVLLVWKPLQW